MIPIWQVVLWCVGSFIASIALSLAILFWVVREVSLMVGDYGPPQPIETPFDRNRAN